MPERERTRLTLRVVSWIGAALLLGAPAPAHSHNARLFATAEGSVITGYAYASSGERLSSVTVHVEDPKGQHLGETRTAVDGAFRFDASRQCDHLLVLDPADGHGAQFRIKAADLVFPPAPADRASEPAPSVGPTHEADLQDAVSAAVARQLRPLREQLDRLENRIRFRDVLGGVGYLVGVAGLAFYFLGVRRRGRATLDKQADRS